MKNWWFRIRFISNPPVLNCYKKIYLYYLNNIKAKKIYLFFKKSKIPKMNIKIPIII